MTEVRGHLCEMVDQLFTRNLPKIPKHYSSTLKWKFSEAKLNFTQPARGSNVSFLSLCPAEKPVSLTYRCPCRFYESNVARANIKHLKILSTPNCSLQIVARLKSNSKQVCIDPKLKWIQEYLEKALNKPRHRTHKKKQQKKRGPLCPSRATPLKSPGRKNGGSRCKRQAL
ncbi:PREDICTED: stromal cell-derived factor 1 [Charadrius vociferus]|uniref:stromal cell-derived factor 1 n=2 Tax=Neoaves TaxID=3078114 RepID=UPI0005218680|nr:PREDICTED: stromal cell-derived factor 1 [Charadrius vociferus]